MVSSDEAVRAGVGEVVERAAAAAAGVGRSRQQRVAVLEAIAAALDGASAEILETAARETALTVEELKPEMARMTGTLRMFADVIREGAWVRAAIDTKRSDPAAVIGPNHDVRKMLRPLGEVVAVFGASNFPLAYGVCGGDTASALAAGCGVVVKEHPAHPATGRLIASIARRAIRSAGADENLLGYVENEDPDDVAPARLLVQHPLVAAVGFTGSRGGGMAIERLARERPAPIPVFAEMGSCNVVVITRAAAEERGEQIAAELGASILGRFGQQCTNTGVVVIDRPRGTDGGDDPIVARLREALVSSPAREMLSQRVRRGYVDRLEEVARGSADGAVVHRGAAEGGSERLAAPALAEVDRFEDRLAEPRYREEIFGPAALVAHTDGGEIERLGKVLLGSSEGPWGQLVACVYLGSVVGDREQRIIDLLARVAGRVVINGVPTGVRVAAGMVHGGPWPATNRPDTTAVGPLAIERWCRPVCFQNCPDELLPPELQDANPLGILRLVNGVMTRDPVVRG